MFFSSFPFDDAGQVGGSSRRTPPKEVDNKRFYEILGVSKNATAAEIKKAFKKAAMKLHPDKSGSIDTTEQFKELNTAQEVLLDPEKRKIYDEYGEEGLKDKAGVSDSTDIFDLFFGGGARRSKSGGKTRGEDVVSHLKVTLEQAYTGVTRKLAINKDVICADCTGIGGPESAIETCALCNGRGIRVQIRQVGPMVQQTQSTCSSCKGQGKSMPENKKCKKCTGVGTVKERKILEVYVPKGVPNRHRIVISGEADEKPGVLPGDVVFVVDQQEHSVFTRRGADLIITKTITLYEALTGFRFLLKHLDNREILIVSATGEIIQPDDVKVIRGEGMPTFQNTFIKGDLYVSFKIEFPLPEQIDNKDLLDRILPKPTPLDINEDDPDLEVCEMCDCDPNEAKKKSTRAEGKVGGAEMEDDENEEEASEGQHPGVQCRQQ